MKIYFPQNRHNTEKVVYFLLLDRKLRNPCFEDTEDIRSKNENSDPPRKRIDSIQLNGQQHRLSLGNISEGSPIASRRALAVQQARKNSVTGTTPNSSPMNSPKPPHRTSGMSEFSSTTSLQTPPGSPSSTNTPWRNRLHTIKNSLIGSPRFHRRKLQIPTQEDLGMTAENSAELTKRSWFGSLMGNSNEREEQHVVMIKNKTLSQIKADLVHAFLSTPDLSHSVLSPSSFRAEYRRSGGTSMFTRNVKFQVDVSSASSASSASVQMQENPSSQQQLHCVTFTLLSGKLN